MYKYKHYRISRDEIHNKRNDVIMLFRNSMICDFNKIEIKNSLFIYSMWESYLKEDSMQKMLTFIKDNNMDFHYIHTSRHASIDTLKKMVDIIKPKAIIPIHSFYPINILNWVKK